MSVFFLLQNAVTSSGNRSMPLAFSCAIFSGVFVVIWVVLCCRGLFIDVIVNQGRRGCRGRVDGSGRSGWMLGFGGGRRYCGSN